MSSLFGSKKQTRSTASPDPEAQDEAYEQANERTRLLPPDRADRDRDGRPYLSPNDPAVSPYNLFSVRAARYFTILLTIITSIWWMLVLVLVFITPPSLHTRGSPFFAFSYASVAMSTLITTLAFFSAPSKSVRILAASTGVMLLVQTIIILSVRRTRNEEFWVGIASLLCR